MNIIMDYNIKDYIDSITEVKPMVLDNILKPYKQCKKYVLSNDVSEYLRYIDEEPFYIPPSFSDVKVDIKLSTR